jgi:hypothetical protein
MKSASQIRETLPHFCGTEEYHWFGLGRPEDGYGLKMTDGILYLLNSADCFWLLSAILSYQHERRVKNLGIQFWRLKVWDETITDDYELSDQTKRRGRLTLYRDTNKPVLWQDIEFTNFPLPEIDVWVADGVAMLRSEY